MKRIVFALMLWASPAFAQTDTASLPALFARVDSLRAQVDTLLRVVGEFRVRPDLAVKCVELPNGECPVLYRQRQLGVAADLAYGTTLPGFQAQLSGIAARLATVEAAVSGGYQVGTAVFDKVRANKVCIGDADCDPDWNADLQIRKNYSAVVGLESNLAKTDPQDPTHTHLSQFSASQDGAPRIQYNAKSTYSQGFVSNVNPCRAWLNLGPDSRGHLSMFVGEADEVTCTKIPHEGAQDLVLLPDYNAKEIRFFLGRPLWNVRFVGSSTTNAGDLTLQPKQ